MFGMAVSAGAFARSLGAIEATSPAQTSVADPLFDNAKRATVSLIHGENRRKNVFDSLVAIDDQIRPVLRTKKSSRTWYLQ
jgi:hypothetical protein